MRRPRHDGGFTLIELLVVMVIVGLLVGVTVPSIAKGKRDRADAAARSTVETWVTGAVQHWADSGDWPTSVRGWAMDEATTLPTPAGVHLKLYVQRGWETGGAVIFGTADDGSTVFAASTWAATPGGGATVTPTELTALPKAPPNPGTYGVPATVDPNAWLILGFPEGPLEAQIPTPTPTPATTYYEVTP